MADKGIVQQLSDRIALHPVATGVLILGLLLIIYVQNMRLAKAKAGVKSGFNGGRGSYRGMQPSLDFASCAVPGWDPAATAEAQALGTTGSLQHDNIAEWKLQSAINATDDANSPNITDAQLQQVMSNGAMP